MSRVENLRNMSERNLKASGLLIIDQHTVCKLFTALPIDRFGESMLSVILFTIGAIDHIESRNEKIISAGRDCQKSLVLYLLKAGLILKPNHSHPVRL